MLLVCARTLRLSPQLFAEGRQLHLLVLVVLVVLQAIVANIYAYLYDVRNALPARAVGYLRPEVQRLVIARVHNLSRRTLTAASAQIYVGRLRVLFDFLQVRATGPNEQALEVARNFRGEELKQKLLW